MTDAQKKALKEIEQRNEFAFSVLPREWQEVPLKKAEPIWYPFYDLEGMLNVAIVQANGEITREVKSVTHFLVTLSTTTQRLVEAGSKELAERIVRSQVDPDMDWDIDAADEMNETHPEWNLYKEDVNG